MSRREFYAGEDSNVAEEALQGARKKKKKSVAVEGREARQRLDRPARRRGGRSSNRAPLSSAADPRDAEDHEATEGNADRARADRLPPSRHYPGTPRSR